MPHHYSLLNWIDPAHEYVFKDRWDGADYYSTYTTSHYTKAACRRGRGPLKPKGDDVNLSGIMPPENKDKIHYAT